MAMSSIPGSLSLSWEISQSIFSTGSTRRKLTRVQLKRNEKKLFTKRLNLSLNQAMQNQPKRPREKSMQKRFSKRKRLGKSILKRKSKVVQFNNSFLKEDQRD